MGSGRPILSVPALRREAKNPYASGPTQAGHDAGRRDCNPGGFEPQDGRDEAQGIPRGCHRGSNDTKGVGIVRRRKKAGHANHERWLVSYADFITLLFAFFVVLFSSSQVDKRKVGRLAMAIQVAFEHLGVFESSNSKASLSTSEPMPFDNVQIIEKVMKTTDVSHPVPSAKGARAEPSARGDVMRLMAETRARFRCRNQAERNLHKGGSRGHHHDFCAKSGSLTADPLK